MIRCSAQSGSMRISTFMAFTSDDENISSKDFFVNGIWIIGRFEKIIGINRVADKRGK